MKPPCPVNAGQYIVGGIKLKLTHFSYSAACYPAYVPPSAAELLRRTGAFSATMDYPCSPTSPEHGILTETIKNKGYCLCKVGAAPKDIRLATG